MKRKNSNTCSDSTTYVVKLGMEFFTTSESSEETEDPQTHAPDVMDKKDLKKSKREKKNGRFYKFVKRHFLQRKSNSNDVKEINILPEGDENKWARRSAGSAASRSSEETVTSEEDRLEVVHDMAEEDILDL